MFKEAIRRLASINESGMRPRQDTYKKSDQQMKRTQSKHFNSKVHLEYNKILICDGQTNNNKIYEIVHFSFLFSF